MNKKDEKTNGSSGREQNCQTSQEEHQFFDEIKPCREQNGTGDRQPDYAQ